jgi:lipopolysaccharide transport system ATP-binding protein
MGKGPHVEQGPAISVSGLSKIYRIASRDDTATTAAEALLRRLRHPGGRLRYKEFRALEDVSFRVPWGEAVGIVGRNGAGKSTLLKVLTRVAAPTAGRIVLGGRVGSLLEVGVGFHPELTGRENVFLNGSLLGMGRKEIQRRFAEIVEFAGVERFLDTQVKRYSSGMHVRLAFSVAAHLEAEIMAVDEVLAVGDADFQGKCLQKMREVVQSGRTVIFVSHQVQTVRALCTSAIYLERGRLMLHGPVDQALGMYLQSYHQQPAAGVDVSRRPGSGELRFSDVRPQKDVYLPHDEKTIEFSVSGNPDFAGNYWVSCHLNDQDGVAIALCDSRLVGFWLDGQQPQQAALTLRGPWLKPGRYTVDLFLCKNGVLDAWSGAAMFTVLPVLPYPEVTGEEASRMGVVLGDFDYAR